MRRRRRRIWGRRWSITYRRGKALVTKRAGAVEGKEKWALWKRMCLEVVRLRRVSMQSEKLELAEERLAWKEEMETERPRRGAGGTGLGGEVCAPGRPRSGAENLRRKNWTRERRRAMRSLNRRPKSRRNISGKCARRRRMRMRWRAGNGYRTTTMSGVEWGSSRTRPRPIGPGRRIGITRPPGAWSGRGRRGRWRREGERLLPKPKPCWSPTGFAEDGEPIQEWEWPRPGDVTAEVEPATAPAPSAEAATAGGQPAAAPPAQLRLRPKCRRPSRHRGKRFWSGISGRTAGRRLATAPPFR